MTDVYNDEYWSTQFDITQDDLKRIADRLERDGAPQDLKTIALRIIRGRLEHGQDLSPSALSKMTGVSSVRLWDPEKDWSLGDIVMIAHDHNRDSIHDPFLGEIVYIDDETVKVRVGDLSKEIRFSKWSPNNPSLTKYDPEKWREVVRRSVQEKLQSQDINQQCDGILLKYGERIVSRLKGVLQSDPRFVGFEGKWYVSRKLPELGQESIRRVYHTLLEKPEAAFEDLVAIVQHQANVTADLIGLTLQHELRKLPERFENTGTTIRSQWKARLPEPAQAQVTHYAYDPRTYEILCLPGKRLTQKQAQRLHELGFYEHVVTFAE